MGDREVIISLIEARIRSAHPTDRRAMVSADDPTINSQSTNVLNVDPTHS